MTKIHSEIDKQIMHLCEVMGIEKDHIRYILINGTEFIGEAVAPDEDATFGSKNDETAFFHPMRINVEFAIDDNDQLCTEKWFSPLASEQPFYPIKNYNILSQSPIYPDFMLEYLLSVHDTYFSVSEIKEPKPIKASVAKSNILYIKDYRKKYK